MKRFYESPEMEIKRFVFDGEMLLSDPSRDIIPDDGEIDDGDLFS